MRLLCVLGIWAAVVHADDKPVPLRASGFIRKGTFTIEGRQKLRKGIKLSIQHYTRIVGKGDDAVLVVEGTLKVTGVEGGRVIFENVTIELAERFNDVNIDNAKFKGVGGIRTPHEKAVSGKLHIEEVDFDRGCPIDVSFRSGTIDLIASYCVGPVTIKCVDPPRRKNSVRVSIHSCSRGFHMGGTLHGGLFIDNADDCTVRLNRMTGDLVVLSNCRKLIFDGNKVLTKTLEFRQDKAGRFSKTKILKCDMYCEKLTAFAPKHATKKDIIRVDKCWFRAHTKRMFLHDNVIEDGRDSPDNGARIVFAKIMEKPLKLAGEAE